MEGRSPGMVSSAMDFPRPGSPRCTRVLWESLDFSSASRSLLSNIRYSRPSRWNRFCNEDPSGWPRSRSISPACYFPLWERIEDRRETFTTNQERFEEFGRRTLTWFGSRYSKSVARGGWLQSPSMETEIVAVETVSGSAGAQRQQCLAQSSLQRREWEEGTSPASGWPSRSCRARCPSLDLLELEASLLNIIC